MQVGLICNYKFIFSLISDAKFKSALMLKRHSFSHSNGRPYKCTFCPRAFTREFCLNRHRIQHPESNPFKCGTCGKLLNDLESLDNHSKTHDEEKHKELEEYPVPISGKFILSPQKDKPQCSDGDAENKFEHQNVTN